MGVIQCQRPKRAAWQAFGQGGCLSCVPGCHCGVQLIGGRGRARQLLKGQPQEGGSRCWQEPQVHFVLVTNGWRRLDLNTSAGDRHPPQPLRYLALEE